MLHPGEEEELEMQMETEILMMPVPEAMKTLDNALASVSSIWTMLSKHTEGGRFYGRIQNEQLQQDINTLSETVQNSISDIAMIIDDVLKDSDPRYPAAGVSRVEYTSCDITNQWTKLLADINDQLDQVETIDVDVDAVRADHPRLQD